MPMNSEEKTSLVISARTMATMGGTSDQKVPYILLSCGASIAPAPSQVAHSTEPRPSQSGQDTCSPSAKAKVARSAQTISARMIVAKTLRLRIFIE